MALGKDFLTILTHQRVQILVGIDSRSSFHCGRKYDLIFTSAEFQTAAEERLNFTRNSAFAMCELDGDRQDLTTAKLTA